jgi:hypothetical protein
MKKIANAVPVLFLISLSLFAQSPNNQPKTQPFKSDPFAFTAIFNGPVKQQTGTVRIASGPVTQNSFLSFNSSNCASTYIQISTFASNSALTEDNAYETLQNFLDGRLGRDDSGTNTVLVQSDSGTFSSYPSMRSITNITSANGRKSRVESVMIYLPERFSIYQVTFMQDAGAPIDPARDAFFGSLRLLTPRAVAVDRQAK